MVRRRTQLLSNPSAREVLIGNLTLDELDLSVQSYNRLRRAGYLSVSKICEMTEIDTDDLQAELERKFEELFGPLDDED